jgi:hypothetical protein
MSKIDIAVQRFCAQHGIDAKDVLNIIPDFNVDSEGKEPSAYFDASFPHAIMPADKLLADWIKLTIKLFKQS